MSHQEELINCYDSQASHFHHTRWFHKRPELEYIKPVLESTISDISTKPVMYDLGCWSGRIAWWLDEQWYEVDYFGADFSQGMIDVANKTYPSHNFYHQDMLSFVQDSNQQSVDCVLSLAAFHHLPTKQERLLMLHNLYRILQYGWVVILINRSYSDWFFKKYQSACLQAIGKSALSLGYAKRNDILVPRKDPKYHENKNIYHRYYHIFTLNELKKLIQLTNFSIQEISYIDQQGNSTLERKNSRNSICILRK